MNWESVGEEKVRRKHPWLPALAAGLLLLALMWAVGVTAAPSVPGKYVPGEILVKWREEAGSAAGKALLSEAGLYLLEELEEAQLARVAVPVGEEEETIQRLSQDPRVAYAEPNYLAHACGAPNDPYWVHQWNMVQVQAPGAWDFVTGTAQVVVALIDTGVDQDHPDLAGRILPGWDYFNGDSDPEDDNGHGTHVAGIAAARGNNGRGVAGVNWELRLLPLKVLDQYGQNATYYNIASAIYYALNQGARVLNLSLGGAEDSTTLHEAVTYAANTGALVIAAAGNQGGQVLYPAAYPEAIAVAATNYWDQRPSYSNYGPEVDIAAPGGDSSLTIFSTLMGGGYGYAASPGTSWAVPHVSGLAGLVWAANPTLSASEVWGIIRDTAEKVGGYPYTGGRNDYLGYGRIRAAGAIRRADPPILQVGPQELRFVMDDAWTPAAQGIHIANASRYLPLTWEAAVTGGPKWVTALPPLSGTLHAGETHTLPVAVDRARISYGKHTGRVRVQSSTPEVVGSPQGVWVYLTYVPRLTHLYLPLMTANPPPPEGYEWLDATVGGVAITLGDDDAAQVRLPFPFPFYGQTYTSIWVSANGFASFGAGYGGPPYYSNHCLPNPSAPNNAIYAFWDDLDPSLEGGVYYKAFGPDTFVIEWEDVPKYGSASRQTFEFVLRADGRIKLQYKDVGDIGMSTIGVENSTGTKAQQYLCNGVGGVLQNQMAIWFESEP
ncbi:MAG: S8 family peptidase [Anaerolineae bacterium]